MSCRFCGGTETRTTTSGHLVESEECCLCSRCVQKLLSLPNETISKAHDLAIEKGLFEKAQILKDMMEGNTDARQENPRRKPRDIGKHLDRRGDKKADRIVKKTTGRLPERKTAPLPEGQPELPPLP